MKIILVTVWVILRVCSKIAMATNNNWSVSSDRLIWSRLISNKTKYLKLWQHDGECPTLFEDWVMMEWQSSIEWMTIEWKGFTNIMDRHRVSYRAPVGDKNLDAEIAALLLFYTDIIFLGSQISVILANKTSLREENMRGSLLCLANCLHFLRSISSYP